MLKATRYFNYIGRKLFGDNFKKSEEIVNKDDDNGDSSKPSKASTEGPPIQPIAEKPSNSKKIKKKKSKDKDDDKYGFSVGVETVNYMYQERSSSKYLIFLSFNMPNRTQFYIKLNF